MTGRATSAPVTAATQWPGGSCQRSTSRRGTSTWRGRSRVRRTTSSTAEAAATSDATSGTPGTWPIGGPRDRLAARWTPRAAVSAHPSAATFQADGSRVATSAAARGPRAVAGGGAVVPSTRATAPSVPTAMSSTSTRASFPSPVPVRGAGRTVLAPAPGVAPSRAVAAERQPSTQPRRRGAGNQRDRRQRREHDAQALAGGLVAQLARVLTGRDGDRHTRVVGVDQLGTLAVDGRHPVRLERVGDDDVAVTLGLDPEVDGRGGVEQDLHGARLARPERARFGQHDRVVGDQPAGQHAEAVVSVGDHPGTTGPADAGERPGPLVDAEVVGVGEAEAVVAGPDRVDGRLAVG